MSNWQPIETAPKDGIEVIAWTGMMRFIAYWDEGWHDNVIGRLLRPTHWMPLDRPPDEETSR